MVAQTLCTSHLAHLASSEQGLPLVPAWVPRYDCGTAGRDGDETWVGR